MDCGPTLRPTKIVNTEEQLKSLVREAERYPSLALDTETTSIDAMRADLVGIALYWGDGDAHYIPVGHKRGLQLPLDLVRGCLSTLIGNSNIQKVMHNAKYDLIVLGQHDMPCSNPIFDTMVAAWMLDTRRRELGLKALAKSTFDLQMTEIRELIGSKASQITMADVSIEDTAAYAGADVVVTHMLLGTLQEKLEASSLLGIFQDFEMPTVRVLQRMESYGVLVDSTHLKSMADSCREKLKELQASIFEIAGHELNINSTQQLRTLLYGQLGIWSTRRTSTGPSTSSRALERIAGQHPVVPLILEYRQHAKLLTTYLDALPNLVNPKTGRIHPSFNQTGTTTGRFSSTRPNAQNIPIRTELGKRVRETFIAPEGSALLVCDYSQIELRLLAHISKDPELIGAFNRGEDVHASTAAALFGIPIGDVTYPQRLMAKTINFGLMYGMSSYGLAERAGLSVDESYAFMEAYFEKFWGVHTYMEDIVQEAKAQGFVSTLIGRRRNFSELLDPTTPRHQLSSLRRSIINLPLQGSAADLINMAMVRIDEEFQRRSLKSRMLMQVHDELIIEVPLEEVLEVRQAVPRIMEGVLQIDVPIKVESAIGASWAAAK